MYSYLLTNKNMSDDHTIEEGDDMDNVIQGPWEREDGPEDSDNDTEPRDNDEAPEEGEGGEEDSEGGVVVEGPWQPDIKEIHDRMEDVMAEGKEKERARKVVEVMDEYRIEDRGIVKSSVAKWDGKSPEDQRDALHMDRGIIMDWLLHSNAVTGLATLPGDVMKAVYAGLLYSGITKFKMTGEEAVVNSDSAKVHAWNEGRLEELYKIEADRELIAKVILKIMDLSGDPDLQALALMMKPFVASGAYAREVGTEVRDIRFKREQQAEQTARQAS